MRRFSAIILSLALVSACGQQYAFPLKAPSSDVLEAQYKAWKHQLSMNEEYHFSVLVPNEWKVLQTTVANEPGEDKPLEIALFREPGAWMEDESVPADGEIVVEVFHLSGSLISGGDPTSAPMPWLKRRLERGLGEYTILNERVFTSLYGPAADLLVRSGGGDNKIVSRLAAFRSPRDPQKIFVIACSVTDPSYPRVAEVFATAVMTFRLENAKVPKN